MKLPTSQHVSVWLLLAIAWLQFAAVKLLYDLRHAPKTNLQHVNLYDHDIGSYQPIPVEITNPIEISNSVTVANEKLMVHVTNDNVPVFIRNDVFPPIHISNESLLVRAVEPLPVSIEDHSISSLDPIPVDTGPRFVPLKK